MGLFVGPTDDIACLVVVAAGAKFGLTVGAVDTAVGKLFVDVDVVALDWAIVAGATFDEGFNVVAAGAAFD